MASPSPVPDDGRRVRRSELRTILVDAESTVESLKRMVDRLNRFTDHLDILAAEVGGVEQYLPKAGGGQEDSDAGGNPLPPVTGADR